MRSGSPSRDPVHTSSCHESASTCNGAIIDVYGASVLDAVTSSQPQAKQSMRVAGAHS